MSPPLDVVFDRAVTDTRSAELRTALRNRDWPRAKATFDAAAPMDRTGLIRDACDEMPGIESFLRSLLSADPADGTASALLGAHLIDVAWRTRGRLRAQYVTREQFTGFREILCRAEQALIDGAQFRPEDPAIWTARVTTARGLELGLAESRRRLDRALAAGPHHLPALSQMLQNLCPKWAGTDWDQVHEFAREAAAAVPPGSPHALLIADAHLEHALDRGGRADMARYLAQAGVRAEITEAAERSIGHPDFTEGYGRPEALSSFALCFTLLDDRRAAAAAFAPLGRLATRFPWFYLGDPAVEIRKARSWALGGSK